MSDHDVSDIIANRAADAMSGSNQSDDDSTVGSMSPPSGAGYAAAASASASGGNVSLASISGSTTSEFLDSELRRSRGDRRSHTNRRSVARDVIRSLRGIPRDEEPLQGADTTAHSGGGERAPTQKGRGSSASFPDYEAETGKCRYDPRSQTTEIPERRVSAMLWESLSFDTAKKKGPSRFDAGGQVEKEQEARWEKCGEKCGRVCRVGCMVVGLLGLAAGIAAAVLLASPSQTGGTVHTEGDSPNAGASETCSEANVRQPEGMEACQQLCERSYCCVVPHWDDLSCYDDNPEECALLKELCSILDPIEGLI